MDLLTFILTTYGITFGLQHKAYPLLSKNEFMKKMLECTYCTGFHAGWISHLLLMKEEPVLKWQFIAELISYGFAGAAAVYIIDTLITKVEEWGVDPSDIEVEAEVEDD